MSKVNKTHQVTVNDHEPEYTKVMNARGDDPHYVRTPPLHTGHFFGPPPEDSKYIDLTTRANSGTLDCRFAIVAMYRLRPYSDYRAAIDGELRNEFAATIDTENRMALQLYEHEPGQFIVSGGWSNYALYELYKERQNLDAWCIIVGPFTPAWAVVPVDRPFRLKLVDYDPYKTAKHIAEQIRRLHSKRGVTMDELMRRADITPDEYAEICDSLRPKAPTIAVLERIARVFGVKSTDILPF